MASLPDHDDEREARDAARQRESAIQDAVAPVVAHLGTLVADAVTKRKPIEERWLADIRRFHGIYDDDVRQMLESGDKKDVQSSLFINLTRVKTNAWSARLADMLFPNDEKNWGIDPTPVPELTQGARELVDEAERLEAQVEEIAGRNNALVAANDAGENVPAFDSEAALEEAKALATRAAQARQEARRKESEWSVAMERARNMERVIDDQLTEALYPAICRDGIGDLCKLGSAILKGPVTRSGARRGWKPMIGDDGQPIAGMFELEFTRDRPTFRRVDPWHFFPDPSATCMKEAEYTLERHLPNKKMLRKLAREMGFNEEAVRGLLKDGPQSGGSAKSEDLGYLVQVRNLENSGDSSNNITLSDRYCLWEFHGSLEIEQIAAVIRAMGRYEDADAFEKDADPLDVKMVRVFFCGTTLLKIDEIHPLDSGESLYSVANFEKGEASILGGVGIPHLMRHEQSMLNSAVRMMMDNGALAVGPQVVIDKEQIEPENGRWTLTPRKIWQRVKSVVSATKDRPFETYDIPMNQNLIASIITLAMQFIDMTVSLPLLAQGESGEHQTQTRGGMSMLFNSASVVFRQVVRAWDDDITTGVITRAYDWNMQFSDDESIKGDMKCEARGTAVLLVRELQAEQTLGLIREFATHPILGVAFKPYDALKLVLQAMSINPNNVLLDNDAYDKKLKELAQQTGPESPEAIRAQSALQVAQIDAESRLAVAQSNERVAEMRLQAEMMALASKENLTITEIEARLRQAFGVEKIRTDSKERLAAAEIGVEREAADRAEARGALPAASGGYVSMGANPA